MPFFGLGKPNIEKLREKRDVKRLCKALSYKDGMVRRGAAFALGMIGDKRAVEPLITALKDPDGNVRTSAAESLGKIGDPRAVEPLITALKDPDGNVRTSAAESLGKIGDPRAVEPLITLAQHEGYARASLKRFDDPRARLPLICAKCNLMMQLPKIGTISVSNARALECTSCNLVFCASCAKRGRVLICPKCGGDLLDMATETPATYTTKATYMSDEAMLDILCRLCSQHHNYWTELNDQYCEPISAAIARLEPLATEIGWELHRRGGKGEMLRMFQKVIERSNQRSIGFPTAIDKLWDRIGDWRARHISYF